ncbi:DUF2312 domain-containing protein [Sphingomonas koreensis]|uniref:DUF2312 domain-containing protein n=2 Tax=Sphingomonas koreensis TaxID=93064 RepID=A0AAJ4S7M7_9SPHN|nr:DUF2312 domain-containing protein [Sphingomonas koreensis]RSU30953.1 DUF2312 domain-containing protein [Sphingomonas koreensis]RSU32255.1 DUF2312 domain-containing protein [Sphingomonas koreensis]RSU39504.1 DUF2312 domain-containing protein [Sphingomonas koreensis]RSU41344.1 DUF2312 domain-containing protein [Sphingomonas koreensis]
MLGAAVGALLVGREETDFDEVKSLLPEHIRSARPTDKAILRAIVAAGWQAQRQSGGHVVYRLPTGEDNPDEGAPGAGHNSGVGAEELQGLMERLDRLEEERKGINDDIKDVYAEAKSTGFDVPTIRAVRKIRSRDKQLRDESDALMETYRNALGLA